MNVTAAVSLSYRIFSGTRDSGVYHTTSPHSMVGTAVDSGLLNRQITAMAAGDSQVFAGTSGKGIFRIASSGWVWEPVNDGLTDSVISTLWAEGTHVVAATSSGKIFLSANRGANWLESSSGLPSGQAARALIRVGDRYLAAYDGAGVYRSNATGQSWTAANTGLTNTTVRALVWSNGLLFAGTNNGVFRSADSGATWTEVNTGLTNFSVFGLAVNYSVLYAATGDGVWSRPMSQFTTSIASRDRNSSRNIRFEGARALALHTDRATRVTVNAYRPDGAHVATLLNEMSSLGVFTRTLNTTGLSKGVYLYRVQTDDVSELHTVVLTD